MQCIYILHGLHTTSGFGSVKGESDLVKNSSMAYYNPHKPIVKGPPMRLYPEQKDAADAVMDLSRLLLADVGAGKTATALHAIACRNVAYGKQRTLVLGTKRICDMVWGLEIEKWLPDYTYASVAGLPTDKRRAILTNPDILVVGLNYENLIWAVKEFGNRLPRLFPNLVVDESSKLENPSSKSFKAIKSILHLFKWRLPMTASPCANYLHDLWGSAYLADLGATFGEYKEAFLQNFFRQINKNGRLEWIPKHDTRDKIDALLKNVAYRMPFKWREPVEIDVVLPLNAEVKAIQNRIDKELKENLEVTFNGVTYARNGSRVNAKMLQLSSGNVYTDDGGFRHIHIDKYMALREIVAEAKGEPMMVVYQFDHEKDGILEAFPQARLLSNDQTLADWNAGLIEILVVHPRSCGHGLNAQLSQCDLQVWFSPFTDAELYTQTVGRLNRPGNPKTVRVIRLIMQGTKDRASYLVVAARQRGENATLESFENDN